MKNTYSSENADLITDYHDLSFSDLFKISLFCMVFPYYTDFAWKQVKVTLYTHSPNHVSPNSNSSYFEPYPPNFQVSIMIIRGLQNLWTSLPYVNQLQPNIILPASWLYYLSPTLSILICHWFLAPVFKGNMTSGKHRGYELHTQFYPT